jgi:hypothetical protein
MMTIAEQLGDKYRFTAKDVALANEIFGRLSEATEDEMEFQSYGLLANEMDRETGKFPTMAEVIEKSWQREDAYWQSRFKRNAPRPCEFVEPDWKALLEQSAAAENEKQKVKTI